MMQGRRMNEAGLKVSRQAPKNPRKNTKKANNAETIAETMITSSGSAMETGNLETLEAYSYSYCSLASHTCFPMYCYFI